MAETIRRLLYAVTILVCCGAMGACARPVGDLGRAQPGVLHDELMPAAGKLRAEWAKEPVSKFNLTDQEREMHNRVWRFLVAPHANDWFMDTVIELQRTRLAAGAQDIAFKRDLYSNWLRTTRYESSRIRFRTIADSARADIDTAPSTFRSICAVIEIDRQRGAASRSLQDLTAGDVAARRSENQTFIAWFTRAIAYRYESYNYALDTLLVETPHEEAMGADAEISQLGVYVERAKRGDFCDGAEGGLVIGGNAIRSRVLLGGGNEGAIRK